MPTRLFDLQVDQVDLVPRGATRDTVDPTDTARWLLFKAEGGEVKHKHAKAGGGAFEHSHVVTGDQAHGHGAKTANNDSDTQLLPVTVSKADLNQKQRDALDDADFGDPENRKYPVTDANDVKDAYNMAPVGSKIRDRVVAIAKRKGLTAALPDSAKEKYGIAKSDQPAPSANAQGDQGMPNDDKTKTGTATETTDEVEIDKSELTPAVRAYLEKREVDLKKAQDDAAEATRRADEAGNVAKSERTLRVRREMVAKAESLSHLPLGNLCELSKAEGDDAAPSSTEALAGLLLEIQEKAPAAYDRLLPVLEAANGVAKQEEIFKAVGRPGQSSLTAGSAEAQLVAKREEIRKAEPTLSPEQAYAKAYAENPELAEQARVEHLRRTAEAASGVPAGR